MNFSPLQVLKECGFNIESVNESVAFSFGNDVILKVSNDNLSGFYFKIESEYEHIGLLISVSVYDLDKEEPKLNVLNHDKVSFFNDIESIERYKEIIEHIDFARKLSIGLVEEIMAMMDVLKLQAIKEVGIQADNEKKLNEEAESNQLERISVYKKLHRKQSFIEAESIVRAMENDCMENKDSVVREFEFLRKDGYPIRRKYKIVREKQQFVWKDNKDNLLDLNEVLGIIQRSWIEKENF